MSLVWTIIASFLYVEIAIVLLFVLPIASPSRWQRFFKSRFLEMINRQAQVYFYLLLGVLVLFLLEAIREMRKYSHTGKIKNLIFFCNHITTQGLIIFFRRKHILFRSECRSTFKCRNAK